MGISIYYQGTINRIEGVPELSNELVEFASILGWEVKQWNGHWNRPNTAVLEQRTEGYELTGHIPLRGVSLLADPECEPLFLTFNSEGALASTTNMLMADKSPSEPQKFWLSTMTHYTSADVHIALIKLLKYLKTRFISDLQVYDETGFWDHEDSSRVINAFNSVNRNNHNRPESLNLIPKRVLYNKTPEQIADLIENMMRNRFGR